MSTLALARNFLDLRFIVQDRAMVIKEANDVSFPFTPPLFILFSYGGGGLVLGESLPGRF